MSTALHNAIAAIPRDCEPLVAAKIRGLLRGYDSRYQAVEFVTLRCEQFVDGPLTNPETMRESRSFKLGGILDVVIEQRGQNIIVDHKTTSNDIADPNAPYWRQLAIEGQASQYMLLEWVNGRKADGCLWDVIRKPQISPKKLSKAERANVVSNRKYFDAAVSVPTLESLQVEERETLEMFEARLAFDCTIERPDWYFQRRPVPRLDAELLEYSQEVWGHAKDILHTRQTGRHLRNPGACMLYGSPCVFLGICSGHDTPDSDKWHKKNFVHSELADYQLPGDGRELLTNSRMRCFQTCRRKHYFDYELGIERVTDEDRESLIFGAVWHRCLEAWFNTFRKGECNVNDDESPANAVGNCTTSAVTS